MQNWDNLSVLQPEALFDWENQIVLPAGPSERIYLEARLLSVQDELTTYLGNSSFPEEPPFYGINDIPELPYNYKELLEDHKRYKKHKHNFDFDLDP